jgi:hypothetical protein
MVFTPPPEQQTALISGLQAPNPLIPPIPLSLPYKVDTSRPSLRTNWTRLIPSSSSSLSESIPLKSEPRGEGGMELAELRRAGVAGLPPRCRRVRRQVRT